MSEFENALEEEANKFIKENVAEENAVTEEEKDWAIVFKSVTRTSFKSGARWSREFTVREICKWVVGEGQFIVRNHCPANLKRAIESHFTPKSTEDGGWE